jgi:hypothetical protein
VLYSIGVSELRRPFLRQRYFFVPVHLLRRREQLTEPDFALLARAFNQARALHPFYLTALILLPDPAGAVHYICEAVPSRIYRLTRTSHNEKMGCAHRQPKGHSRSDR